MVIGGLISAAGVALFALQTTKTDTTYNQWIPWILMISIGGAIAFAAWMAAFTETVEKHNPAATATGLAVLGLDAAPRGGRRADRPHLRDPGRQHAGRQGTAGAGWPRPVSTRP